MNHQPFETWLLDHSELTSEQHIQLESHLEECTQCRKLASALQVVEKALAGTSAISPAPGFLDRWRSSLPARRTNQHREESRRLLIGLSGGAALALLVLIVLNSNAESISSLAASLINLYVRTSTIFSQVRNFIFILMNGLPSAFGTIIIVVLTGWLIAGIVLWIYTITHSRKGVIHHETN